MTWPQNYAPLGGLVLSALVAALPVVTLLALLAFWHVRAHIAALAGLAVAMVVAIVVYQMPWQLTAAASVYGAAFGLFPIGWIVLNAIFIYQLSVDTGQFEALKTQIAGLAADRRIQALLIAFAFGAFIEGCAGFGAPVAITGAMMIGLGFKPLEAAKLALIGNTAPVAFGSLGIPLTTLADVTGLDVHALSAMAGRQLPIFSCIVPFWLVAAQCGWRGMLQVWPACLVCGVSFGIVQFLVSNFHGPWLVDIAAALVSMAALVVLLRFWKPASAEAADHNPTGVPGNRFRAWLPWVLLSLCVAVWKVKPIETWLNGIAPWKKEVPALHLAVQKMPPIAKTIDAEGHGEREPAIYKFNLPAMTGSALLLAGVLSGLLLRVRPVELARLYMRCLWRVRISLLTIAIMLALGYTTKYSGTDTTMGLLLAQTGWFFPFFSPMIGWLGVALTGSDTSSNVLFGNLQKVSAEQLGLSPILTAASNSSGGVMGKMIDAQSIVVASVATGGHADSPDAGTVLRAVFWHSLALALLVGGLVMAQAYLFPWMIPVVPTPQ
jgi:lactate permease